MSKAIKDPAKVQNHYHSYINSYSGKELLKKHPMTKHGVWRIYGEDPNCDLGGHHHEPLIATVSGTLQDVIAYAVYHPRFWQWGYGGRIEYVDTKVPAVPTGYAQRVIEREQAFIEQAHDHDRQKKIQKLREELRVLEGE